MSNSSNLQNGANPSANSTADESGELRKATEAALNMAREARQEVSQIQEERERETARLEEEIEAVRGELEEVRSATRLLDHVADAGQLDIETRAAICIQTVHNEAREADDDMAYLTAREAWTALGRSVDRTRMYDVFRTAERLYAEAAGIDVEVVGIDDPIYFKTEDRGHQPPSRLVVDLSNGSLRDLDLPRTEVAGR